MLCQELVDPMDRAELGEFYTPDWLAELALEEIGYSKGTLLDPACGSGSTDDAAEFTCEARSKGGALLRAQEYSATYGVPWVD